jgi:hypothetical protein
MPVVVEVDRNQRFGVVSRDAFQGALPWRLHGQHLVVGAGVHGGHQTGFQADSLVQQLDQRGQAIGSAQLIRKMRSFSCHASSRCEICCFLRTFAHDIE